MRKDAYEGVIEMFFLKYFGCLSLLFWIVLGFLCAIEFVQKKNSTHSKRLEGKKRLFRLLEYNSEREESISTDKSYPFYLAVHGTEMENRNVPFKIDSENIRGQI